MTFSAGDRAVIIPSDSGKNIPVKLEGVVAGDRCVIMTDSSGKQSVVKLNPVAAGDRVYVVPSNGGKNIVVFGGSPTYPNPINLVVTGYSNSAPCTYQHQFHLTWDNVTGSYDTVWIEYSTTGFSTNPGDGTFIGNYAPTTLTVDKYILAINSWHYFTAWGMIGGVVQPASKSRVKSQDISPLAHLDFSRFTLEPNPTFPTNACTKMLWNLDSGHVEFSIPAKPWTSPLSFYFTNDTFGYGSDVEVIFSDNYLEFNIIRNPYVPYYYWHEWYGRGGWDEVARYVSMDVTVPSPSVGLYSYYCTIQVGGYSVYDGSYHQQIFTATADGVYNFDLGVVCHNILIHFRFMSNNPIIEGDEFNCIIIPTFSI